MTKTPLFCDGNLERTLNDVRQQMDAAIHLQRSGRGPARLLYVPKASRAHLPHGSRRGRHRVEQTADPRGLCGRESCSPCCIAGHLGAHGTDTDRREKTRGHLKLSRHRITCSTCGVAATLPSVRVLRQPG